MPTDEKPLLPVSTSPASSTRSSASQQHHHLPPTSPAAKLLLQATSTPPPHHKRRSLLNKKRFLFLVVVYGIVAVGWYRDVHARAWKEAMESIERWRDTSPCLDGSGAICDAYGHPFVHPSPIEFESVNSSLVSSQPLSPLGWEADNVYHLGPPLFLTNPAVYLSTLEDFLRKHFPPSDSDESDPNSLINALRSFFPSASTLKQERIHYPSIPRTIWQTAPTKKYYSDKEDIVQTWTELNEGWDVRFHDNELADRWVRKRFDVDYPQVAKKLEGEDKIEKRTPRKRRNRKARKGVHSSISSSLSSSSSTHRPESSSGSPSSSPPPPKPKMATVLNGGERGVLAAWDRLETPAVLRSDFWRYLVLAVEGGVYADTDVECMKPVEEWGLDIDWEGRPPADYEPPSCIVGVEADVGDRRDWAKYWPRPLQFSQWTMASTRGHPIMLDAVRRVVEQALAPVPKDNKPVSVMERTGPGLFTDSVLAYLQVKYRKNWTNFQNLGLEGWRFHHGKHDKGKMSSEGWGDVKVLQITGFSPGIGHMGAENKEHPAAMASHYFAGSWRTQEGADA
ncbi:hypothetical protein JCM3765_006828 [Sporobolomyces pararoseus]